MAKLPRLDRLRRGLVAFDYGFGVSVHDRVFNGYTWNICIPESRKQGRAFLQLALHLVGRFTWRRAGQPTDPGIAKPGAWRMGNKQIPAIAKQGQGVRDNVAF
jgi:hypothetical protein